MPGWTEPEWLAEARSWIDAQLAELGVEPTGAIEQPHVRPWSTVLRLPSSAGDLWFKANHPSLAHEAGVVALISRHRPGLVPELLAADLERGQSLEHLPRVREWSAQLAAFGIPETIQHDDFHDGQIFVQDRQYLFFDW